MNSPIKRLKRLVYSFLCKPVAFPLPYHGIWLKGWAPIKVLRGHEPETTRFYERMLKPGDRVADVGAANGYYTRLFDRLDCEVIAFEANPHQLKNLMWAIGRRNIPIHNVAISDTAGKLTLSFPDKKFGLSSVSYKAGEESIVVPAQPLKEFGRFDWVKIDVEGAELQVLKGMLPAPATVEYSVKILAQMGVAVEAFLLAITELGYTIHFINPDGTTIPLEARMLPVVGHANLYLEPVR